MAPTLYYFAASPPARTALLAAKAVGVDVEVKIVDLFKIENKSPEFLKINPQHFLPTLSEGDFHIWESGAIAAYLVNAYGKDDSLYPKDPKKRAIVDQRLHFGNGTLFARLRALVFPIFFLGNTKLDLEKKKEFEEAIRLLNIFLEGHKYAAGDSLTIADIALVTSVSSFDATGWKFTAYNNVMEWLARCKKEIPGYDEVNQTGADEFGEALKAKLEPGQF